MQKFWDDLAQWPPLAVTGIYLALIAFAVMNAGEAVTFDLNPGWLTISSPSWWMLIYLALGVWHYGVYRACIVRTPSAAPRASGIFVLAVVTLGAMLVSGSLLWEQRTDPPPWLLTFVSLTLFASVFGIFACVWATAAALVEAERSMSPIKLSKFGTFLQLAYLPIGIWFLHGRIVSVLRRMPTAVAG